MTKKLIHGLFLCLLVFSVAILAGYLAFRITYQTLSPNPPADTPSDVVSAAMQSSVTTTPFAVPSHFLACLEHDTIAIYAISQNNKSFLYRFPIRISALSEGDRKNLESGILLPDQPALAAFEEDFSS